MSAAIQHTPALASVLRATARGWRPFPLDHPSHPDCIGGRCTKLRRARDVGRTCADGMHDQRGKHPVGHWPTQAATAQSAAMLRNWFGNAAVNVGIACKPSGLIVLDEDDLDALERFAAELGQTLPRTYRVRTSRGWHWYFSAPDGVTVGNRTGALKARHIDVRGGVGDGGYVVAAGSTHHTGHVYAAEDESAPLAALPAWIVEQIQQRIDGPSSGVTYDPDDVRAGTAAELEATYRTHLAAVTTPGFQQSFFTAARDGWRLVQAGVLGNTVVLTDLAHVVHRVWGKTPDKGDDTLMRQAWEKAQQSPWEVLAEVRALPVLPSLTSTWTPPVGPETASVPSAHADTASTGGAADGNGYDPAEIARLAAEKAHEDRIAKRVEQIDEDAEARRRIAARDRAAREPIAAGLLDCNDLDELPDPVMLLAEVIPEASIGVLAGKFGTYKSFLTLSWACCLAAGRPWLGRDEFKVRAPIRVLYIAAEGASGMKRRAAAWARQFGPVPRGQLDFYPRPVRFNDEQDVAELSALIADRGYGLVIVDTLHRSAPGVEENSSTEVGAILDTAATLRDDHGCTVLFVDHTGHGGGRPRGASAKEDDSDFVLLADLDGDERSADVPRVLRQRKLKEQDVEKSWPLRLVADAAGAYVEIGQPVDNTLSSPFGRHGQWWDLDAAAVPEDVAALKGKGQEAALDIFRLLRFVGGERGLSPAEVRAQLAEARTYHRSTVHAALGLLDGAGVTVPGSTKDRLLLAPRFTP